jgi:hypothetical protein
VILVCERFHAHISASQPSVLTYGYAAADEAISHKAKTLFLPKLRLDQNPKDHQMRNKYEGGVEGIDVPKGG